MSSPENITTAKKRRGVSRASLTRLSNKVNELEAGSAGDPANTLIAARQLLKKLESVDSEFKGLHLALIDLLDTEEDLAKEQKVLDTHDEIVDELYARVNRLILSATASTEPEPRTVASKRLARLKKSIDSVSDEIAKLDTALADVCLVRQREEQLRDLKHELSDISRSLVALDLDDKDELIVLQSTLDTVVFDNSLKIKRLLERLGTPAVTDSRGVKLPKIDVPSFNGNILYWRSFWEQFTVAVHTRTDMTDSEKLVYLRHSVKDGSARQVIEGLSRTGDNYPEAVDCLRARYDRPRLIHQTHVKKILEVPPLKQGSGKELRHLHDTVQQHLRALKAMGHEPSGAFITSALELKLDAGTMFEWNKHSSGSADVPHYHELLEFINLRAQASEHTVADNTKRTTNNEVRKNFTGKSVLSFAGNATSATDESCPLCKTDTHPLFACSKFKALPQGRMMAVVKSNRLCLNCLRPGHFVQQCKSLHKCRECQKPHHTLLHLESNPSPAHPTASVSTTDVSSHTAAGLKSNALLMTCELIVSSPSGLSTKARALLDSGSSASFVSSRLASALNLPHSQRFTRISGIAGLSHSSSTHLITTFQVSPLSCPSKRFEVSAIVIPRVTRNLPVSRISFPSSWDHLQGLQLADPSFGSPGAIDLLLGVDIFVATLLNGRRSGPPGSPTAIETEFGWVLAGNTDPLPSGDLVSHHVSHLSSDDLLRRFWEVEEAPLEGPVLSAEEKAVVNHFNTHHYRSPEGRFVVPLPKRSSVPDLGESRSQAVKRFLNLERSLRSREKFSDFAEVMREYFTLGHAEEVPLMDLHKPPQRVFYLPMHAVRKESSTTTKTRVVFDASAKSSTGISLNDILMVGPTIHPPLVDVLLRFRLHCVAITADVSKMYRAVELAPADRDYHRFVWRSDPDKPLVDYRMTRVTFGVSASSFAANMSVKQNAVDFERRYPLAAAVVEKSLYVDDCLTGADTTEHAAQLQTELQALFNEAHFLLRKWNSSDPNALRHVASELREDHLSYTIPDHSGYTKTLGVQWNSQKDVFRLTITDSPVSDSVTKRQLTSDLAKTFDVLGWVSPAIIKAKILLQRLWERKVDWDDTVPPDVFDVWRRWRLELPILSDIHLRRCHFTHDPHQCSVQLHGFSDASEEAYSAVVYLRVQNPDRSVSVSLVMSKTRVAPLKRQTIPRLELCGALLLSRILTHVKQVFSFPCCELHAWTDSTVVLAWLDGDPRRFKPYVGNRVTQILENLSPNQWRHVSGIDNPADCASRGLFPSELIKHNLWWNGPDWLSQDPSNWPQVSSHCLSNTPQEESEFCHIVSVDPRLPLIPLNRYSTFTRLQRITAWILRFINNCRTLSSTDPTSETATSPIGSTCLTVSELAAAEKYWIKLIQEEHFSAEIASLHSKGSLPNGSRLISYHPFLDSDGIVRVGGRETHSKLSYSQMHPIILCGKHSITRLIIRSQHLRLLHAGPTLLSSSLSRRFSIIGLRKTVRSVTRQCITCRRLTIRPQPQMMGQLPLERITPGSVFNEVGVDYAGPLYVKCGMVRRTSTRKAYICLFVSLAIKAVHLELVSDLTTEAFIATLRRFIARRGHPSLIWSDHGRNFVGASRELRELHEFLTQQATEGIISQFCSTLNIQWRFTPERGPHFGGLWEAAVKSAKTHLKRVVGDTQLTFEEMTTFLTQVEACLNSRPLVAVNTPDDDGIEALTPGHFLIGQPLCALPDPSFSYRTGSLLQR